MAIEATGIARIRHATTGTVYTISADELEWEEIDSEERPMGPEITYQATIDHPELGPLTWSVWEYPLGVENHREVNSGPHAVVETFRITVSDDDGAAQDRENRIQQMVDWFFENFQDPANSLPYESAEGGYIWIDGGPYDASEQIGNHFSGEPQGLIDAAVERVQRDGIYDWAQILGADFYEEGPEEPDDADDEEQGLSDGAVLSGGPAGEPFLQDILASVPTGPGPVFGTDDQGRLELLNWTPSPVPDPALVAELRAQVADLIGQLAGTNGHTELLAAAQKYADAVAGDQPSIARLYASGVNLENMADWTDAAIAAGDRPPLSGSSAAVLRTVVNLHGALIASTPEGSALIEAAARYNRLPEQQEALNRSVAQVEALVQQAQDVFGPEARALAAQAAGQTGQGRNPARSNQISAGVIGGMIGALAVLVGGGLVEGVVVGGLLETSLAVGAKEGVTALGNAAGTFLIGHVDALGTFAAAVGPELNWLRRLTEWIRMRRVRNGD